MKRALICVSPADRGRYLSFVKNSATSVRLQRRI